MSARHRRHVPGGGESGKPKDNDPQTDTEEEEETDLWTLTAQLETVRMENEELCGQLEEEGQRLHNLWQAILM